MRAAVGVALAASLLLSAQERSTPASGGDVVLRAMKDELERSRKLALPGLETPYFIEYSLDDVQAFTTAASLGAALGTNQTRIRVPRVRVRVGDYAFDNTNYVLSDLPGGGRLDSGLLPLDNDYGVHRREWWLATDRAYKGALAAIARKRAALKNVTRQEELPDFSRAQPVQISLQLPPAPDSSKLWETRVRKLSETFRDYPEAAASKVTFNRGLGLYRYVNTEGTELQRPEPLAHIVIQASGYAADGLTVRDAVSLPRLHESALPPEEDLTRAAKSVADNIRALAKAPVGESYSGPVLFEGIAGAQVMAEVLAPALALQRRPVGEPGRPLPFTGGELEGKLESRVLPEFLTVVDDPTKKEWNGAPLIGSYEVDEEGVVPKPLTLIDKGRLKGYVLTRQPVKGFDASNGRARLPGAFGSWSATVTNLFVQPSEAVSGAELKQKFLKLLQDRNKPWGLIVRKMDFPSGAETDEARRMVMAAQQSGSVTPVSSPVLVYKVTPDGKEELVRGMRFRGLNVRSLRDISAVSSESYALHYLANHLPFAMLNSGGYVAPVSVVAPALLFDELELEPARDDLPKLPVVPAPPLGGRTS